MREKPAIRVDLQKAGSDRPRNGPQWAHESEDLDLTLLTWENGRSIEAHINSEVDVVLLGVAGAGEVTVDGKKHELTPGVALLIPKGAERAISATSESFRYLSVHRRRRGLMPTMGGRPLV